MKEVVLVFLWAVSLMTVWTFCGKWVSAPNTFLNLLGGALGVAFIVISVKTVCFTKKWKKQSIKKQKTEKQ